MRKPPKKKMRLRRKILWASRSASFQGWPAAWYGVSLIRLMTMNDSI